MISKAKRNEMETHLYTFFDMFDPTGRNTAYYKEMFGKMSDGDFEKYFKTLFADEDPYITCTMIDYENPVEMKNLEKAADFIGVPIFEKVVTPYNSPDPSNPIVTKHECLVGYLNLKRMQQINFKKIGLSTDTGERNMLTNQVIGHDKNSRNSDAETSALLTIGANESLKEFMSGRADDMVMKNQMNRKIKQDGYVAMSDLDNDLKNKQSLNTVSAFLIGAGIMNDLVMNDYILPKTIDED